METILKFDRCILTKELNEKIKKVGEVFEVADVLDDSFLLREAKSKVAVGVISFKDFDKYFVKEDSFKGWTQWTPLVEIDGRNDCYYRTNRKKTQVRFLTDKVRGESCCHRGDDFNLYIGVQTAYLRCCNKLLSNQYVKYFEKKLEFAKKMDNARAEIAENKMILKKIINSLNA